MVTLVHRYRAPKSSVVAFFPRDGGRGRGRDAQNWGWVSGGVERVDLIEQSLMLIFLWMSAGENGFLCFLAALHNVVQYGLTWHTVGFKLTDKGRFLWRYTTMQINGDWWMLIKVIGIWWKNTWIVTLCLINFHPFSPRNKYQYSLTIFITWKNNENRWNWMTLKFLSNNFSFYNLVGMFFN